MVKTEIISSAKNRTNLSCGKKRGAKSDKNVDIFYGGSNKGSYMYIRGDIKKF